MIVSNSVRRRLAEQQRHKQPRVPSFPPHARATYDRLDRIIDADPNPRRRSLASSAMTRLCVVWSGLASFGGDGPLVFEMMAALHALGEPFSDPSTLEEAHSLLQE